MAASQNQSVSAAVPNDGMDENEREIARIMQEEANGYDDRGAAAAQSMGGAGIYPPYA